MNKIIIVALICLVIGFLIGFQLGAYVTIKSVARVAGGFVDEEMVKEAIYMYENHIKGCFPSYLNIS